MGSSSHVAKGKVLLRLDDRDLALQRLRLTTQRSQDQLEFDRALASRDRSQMAISQSRVAQADAQIALIDNQLERAQLRARCGARLKFIPITNIS